jgi:hypothetical protein
MNKHDELFENLTNINENNHNNSHENYRIGIMQILIHAADLGRTIVP